jgi:hypothetical protein
MLYLRPRVAVMRSVLARAHSSSSRPLRHTSLYGMLRRHHQLVTDRVEVELKRKEADEVGNTAHVRM